MTKRYEKTFVVRGRGPFPLDMLRKDECFPATEGDAAAAQTGTVQNERTVTLKAYPAYTWWTPTAGRWESFGWRVVEQP